MKTQIGCTIVGGCLVCAMALGGPLPGAIFTTMPDGSRVNANIYTNEYDVCLDGGPGPNAPAGAAGLPEGNYYFQVTDPSGKRLLSEDPVECRTFHVNEFGVIDSVVPSVLVEKYRGKLLESVCAHETGIDIDHAGEGAITVQLMPYKKTPNKGGVYKVWITPVEKFEGDPSLVDNSYHPPNYHGFIPRWSKTDNYKVLREGGGNDIEYDVYLFVYKFLDLNGSGWWDRDFEPPIGGWPLMVPDPDIGGITNNYYTPLVSTNTPYDIDEPALVLQFQVEQRDFPFKIIVSEEMPDGWFQTALVLNDNPLPVFPSVEILYEQDETTNTVIFGNMTYGDAVGIKFYDRNANGVWDEGEPPVEGVLLTLSGLDVLGNEIDMSGYTDGNGVVLFEDLLPGGYVMSEVLPPDGWLPTTPTSAVVQVLGLTTVTNIFGNAAMAYGGFGTKGFWHNKNGLELTTLGDLAYLNGLSPWLSLSTYFDAGDEPLDGEFEDGTPVAAANGILGEELAPLGSPFAEQSHFLIDSNANGDPREQLAQQLDAFIMNTRHMIGGGLVIQLPSGDWVLTSGAIADAVLVWEGTDADAQHTMATLLDTLNNNGAVPYVPWAPIPVVY